MRTLQTSRPAKVSVGLIVLFVGVVAVLGVAVYVGENLIWWGKQPPKQDWKALIAAEAKRANGITSDEQDMWPVFREILDAVVEADETAGAKSNRKSDGSIVWNVDFYELPAEAPVDDRAAAGLGPKALEAMRALGVYERLDRLVANPRAAHPSLIPENPTLQMPQVSEMAITRQLGRALMYEFRHAPPGDAGDAERLAAARRGLALARVLGAQPLLIHRLTGVALAAHVHGTCRSAAMSGELSPSAARTLATELRAFALPPVASALEGERLFGGATIDSMLSDSRVIPVSRGANLEKLDEFYARAKQFSEGDRATRKDARSQLDGWSDSLPKLYATVRMLVPAIGGAMAADDMFVCERNAAVLILLIEAHIKEHGTPPATLDDLRTVMPELPTDPFTKDGYRYAPTSVDGFRPYTLYTVGADGVDDGGKMSTKDPRAGLSDTKGKGFDFVFSVKEK
jgi:hypothetical protein